MPRPSNSPSPPPANFPFTAGDFDFPHASALLPNVSQARQSRSISRALRSFTDRSDRTSSASSDGTTVPRHLPRRTPRAARRGPMHRLFGPPRDSDIIDDLSRRPPTANPNRPRATPSERYLQRTQARIRAQRADMESAADLLNSLSDVPITHPFPPVPTNIRARSPTVEVSSDRRQTKRRKLEHSTESKPEYDGFKYGYKGQVVQGRLKMEIVSCDGGEYYEKNNPTQYRVQNVLKNDKSVYCSESSKCNLLLQHIGEAPFTLEKIVIKAPNRGFTAPIQEGLIFVAMSADELKSSTSAYNLQYQPRSPLRSPTPTSPADDEQLSLQEAMEDPHIWHYIIHGHTDGTEGLPAESLALSNGHPTPSSELGRRRPQYRSMVNQDDAYGDNCDHVGDDSYTGVERVSAPTPPPFTISTGSEEDSSDSNQEVFDRIRREGRWHMDDDDQAGDASGPFGGLRRAPPLDERDRRARYFEPRRTPQLGAPSRIERVEHLHESENLARPIARFFIAKNKRQITIKFPAAISGRNILLKLWSPQHDGNIDIESVQFFGFSGPRYFPAIQPC